MIADPMADLTGDASQTAGSDHVGTTKEVFDPMAMQMNLKRIDRIRAVMGIAAGCVAGTAGFTGLQGLVCFISLHLFVCVSIWAFKMGFDLASYTKQSWLSYLTTSIQPTALSFTLFWTLFYGLVYLF